MKIIIKAILLFTLIFVISCGASILKKEEITLWLGTISGDKPHEINISGKWRDAKGNFLLGWGEGFIRQDKNKISGAIGNYNIKGVVSGKKVYLVFLSGGSVYYTARLEMLEKGKLLGNYFEAYDKDQSNGYPTSFSKIEDLGT